MDAKSVANGGRATIADYRLAWIACIPLTGNGPFFSVTDEALKAVPLHGISVYLFCRRKGGQLIPQYIGCSKRIRKRIREHLERVSLMRALADGAGKRIVLVAMVQSRRGQRATRVAHDVELSLIRRFRDAGYALVNERGARTPLRTVRWLGTDAYRKLIPREMKL